MSLIRRFPNLFWRVPSDASAWQEIQNIRAFWDLMLPYLDCRADSVWYTLARGCLYLRFRDYCDLGMYRDNILSHELELLQEEEEMLNFDEMPYPNRSWHNSTPESWLDPWQNHVDPWNFYYDSD